MQDWANRYSPPCNTWPTGIHHNTILGQQVFTKIQYLANRYSPQFNTWPSCIHHHAILGNWVFTTIQSWANRYILFLFWLPLRAQSTILGQQAMTSVKYLTIRYSPLLALL